MKSGPCNGADLRGISLDYRRMTFLYEPFGQFHTKIAAGDPYQIDHAGADASGGHDGFCSGIRDISQTDGQRLGQGCDLSCFRRMLRHDRTRSQSQYGVCAVINSNGMSNAVNQRR